MSEFNVPELTPGATIKLNERLSLRRYVGLITWPSGGGSSKRRRNIAADDTPPWPAFTADLKGQVMSGNKPANEAHKAFRSSDKKAPLTEHEEKQRALLKNLERLKAERLAREAAKSRDD